MRSVSEWAKKHRAGERRALDIIARQDNKPPLSPGSVCIRYKQDRESERRRRQIDAGQLTIANGLAT